MMEGQVAARGDSVTQGRMSAEGQAAAIKLSLKLLRICGEGELSGKRFLIDRGACAGQWGEGRNYLAHPRKGEELPRGAGALL